MKDQIKFEEFTKVEVRVGTILEASVPEGSERLIQFRVDFKEEQRTIFSGIKEWYTPEELVGVKTLWVTNIPPRKLPFGESEGMIFACDDSEGKPYIVRVGNEVEDGSVFH